MYRESNPAASLTKYVCVDELVACVWMCNVPTHKRKSELATITKLRKSLVTKVERASLKRDCGFKRFRHIITGIFEPAHFIPQSRVGVAP